VPFRQLTVDRGCPRYTAHQVPLKLPLAQPAQPCGCAFRDGLLGERMPPPAFPPSHAPARLAPRRPPVKEPLETYPGSPCPTCVPPDPACWPLGWVSPRLSSSLRPWLREPLVESLTRYLLARRV
jgi:hypothetical protein